MVKGACGCSCQGLYSATPPGKFVPGLEFSGTILEMGRAVAEVDGWKPAVGDKVMGVTRFGGYATHVLCEATYVRALPPGWGFQEGASFLCTALTAWYGLVKLGALSENQTVLVHSAAGGVGLASLEIVAAHGAQAIATIGSPAKAQMLRDRMDLEPHAILVRPSSSQEFRQQLDVCLEAMEPPRVGIDIVMDSIQGPYFQPAYDKLARGGRMVVFGAASMTPAGDRPNWLKLAWHWLRRPMVRPYRGGDMCAPLLSSLLTAHMTGMSLLAYPWWPICARIRECMSELDVGFWLGRVHAWARACV